MDKRKKVKKVNVITARVGELGHELIYMCAGNISAPHLNQQRLERDTSVTHAQP